MVARRSSPFPVLAILAVTASACTDGVPLAPEPAVTAAVVAAQRSIARRAPGDRYVIVAKNEVVSEALRAAVAMEGGRVERSMDAIGVLTARGLSTRAITRLRSRLDVEAVGADMAAQWIPPVDEWATRTVGATAGPGGQSDQRGAAFFNQFQWNLRVTRASNAWLVTDQGAGALVCILDTGIDGGHQDLAGKVDPAKSTSFVVTEPTLDDFDGHGTAMAGLVSSNGIGMGSVAPDSKLCGVKVLNRTGSGTFADVTAGVVFAALVDADVINMSLGAYAARDDFGQPVIRALQRAINFATRRGALVVASAGNNGVNLNTDAAGLIVLPAELNNVVSVGATAPVNQQNFDRVASYSNYGNSGVDIFAPGGDFVTGSVIQDLILFPCSRQIEAFDCSGGASYLLGAGTSPAAPHVAGAAAVVESEYRGDQKAAFLQRCLFRGADRVTGVRNDPVYGRGRLNVLGAALCAPVGTVLAGNPARSAEVTAR
jgi:subtilisin family serine protease